MPGNNMIGIRQFTKLVILVTVGDSILILPAGTTTAAGQDAWLSSTLGLLIGMLVVYLLSAVGNLYPRLTLVGTNEMIWGKWLGNALSLAFLLFALITAAAVLREIGDFLTTYILVETPIEIIMILFLSITIMGSRLGLEALARSGEIVFPWFMILFFAFVILLLPQIKMDNLQPMLENGIKPVIHGSLRNFNYPFVELVVFLMLIPNIQPTKEIQKGFALGALIGGVVLIMIVALSILVLGPSITQIQIFPGYALATKISVANAIQRVEAIVAIMWFVTIYFKLTIYFYASNLMMVQLFRLQSSHILLVPLAVFMDPFSRIIAPNFSYYLSLGKTWPLFNITFGILLPLLLLGGNAVRNRVSDT
ncbi:UNVERIFIED_CONTAM: spore germination protein KB [Brevibacillus sp. OAP136]